VPVPLANLLAAEFLQAPEVMFSEDKYHPSAAGYALAAKQLFPALCQALGESTENAMPQRRVRRFGHLWRRSMGVPAPVVVPAQPAH
jgi:hypothetical protein